MTVKEHLKIVLTGLGLALILVTGGVIACMFISMSWPWSWDQYDWYFPRALLIIITVIYYIIDYNGATN